ncbi:hypothetical protein P5673_014399 [Acropora cervicornis]|uniref:Tyr recombinase domain-containing protein n=1 Tax=Acropora cervicornis TaxID=6130 RepID=A0AAD9QJW0_ACRCE|nr:hypothetical protein P5673_014399 [Acropora cervicornis]
MFKSYLEIKLEERGKQIEGKSETDKQVGQLRFKGNERHKTKSGYMMRSSRLSYSLSREIFKEALGVLGCDPKVYGLHSLRSGEITLVVNNNDSKIVSERLLKMHDRWKTDVA